MLHHSLGPAARGAARLPDGNCLGLRPRSRTYISAGVAAVVAGIGANGLLLQMGRHPAPLLALVAHDPLPASASTAAPAGTVEPVALYAPPTPTSEYSTASAAAPPGGNISRTTQAPAPDTTSSIAPAAQDTQHQSSRPNGERRSAALGPDQIGALLRGGKPETTDRPLVRAAQIALAEAPGYAVKSDGVEDGATRRAPSPFSSVRTELTPTTKISSELVKQLTGLALGRVESSSEGKRSISWASRSDRFGKEFAAEAVRLVEVSGRTQREIARDLGVGLSTLRLRWLDKRREHEIEAPPPERQEDLAAELEAVCGARMRSCGRNARS